MPIFTTILAPFFLTSAVFLLCGKAQDPPQRTVPPIVSGAEGVKSIKVSVEPYYQLERSQSP